MNRRRPPFDPTDRGPFLTPPSSLPRTWDHLKKAPATATTPTLHPDFSTSFPDRTRLYRAAASRPHPSRFLRLTAAAAALAGLALLGWWAMPEEPNAGSTSFRKQGAGSASTEIAGARGEGAGSASLREPGAGSASTEIAGMRDEGAGSASLREQGAGYASTEIGEMMDEGASSASMREQGAGYASTEIAEMRDGEEAPQSQPSTLETLPRGALMQAIL